VNYKSNLKICAFLVCASLLFGWHVYATQKAVEQARSVLINKYDKALRDEETKALRTSNQLQASADNERQKKDEKIDAITRERDAALVRLRNRPTRPTTATKDTPSVQACTGRELYREDGEFLTREAARAESILAERDYYYQQYEEVRKKYGNSE
jgi:hypothetical protein